MKRAFLIVLSVVASAACSGCGIMHDYYNMACSRTILAQPEDAGTTDDPDTPVTPSPLFSFGLGTPVTPANVSDQDLLNDFDGDTIPNSAEVTTNPYIAEYPKIVTRIDTPISVEIRSDSVLDNENYSESISGSETKDTLSNCMEDKQYTQGNKKTTPIITKESQADSSSDSSSWGFSDTVSSSSGGGSGFSCPYGGFSENSSDSTSTTHSENGSKANSFARSASSEKTVFRDIQYVDNLDRNGVEISNSKVKTMTSSYRNSSAAKNTTTIGPNAGVVSSCLHIHNLSVNFPVHISDVKCTLSFRMPSGQCQAVRTFTLRNDDYTLFSADVYGDEEKGPYAIVIDGLNTDFIKKALANGWVPQIHVVSYTTSKVKDSNYDPGVDNLKIVEEKAKGRTAFISIRGFGVKEQFRVAAFDVQQDGSLVPGISLKKVLFNIMADRIGSGEKWNVDGHGKDLTVSDRHLKWMNGGSPEHVYGSNTDGNSWRSFETYVKQYTDDTGKTCRIETVKRLYSLKKYNPFDPADNSRYNVSELLSNAEIEQMQFWLIYHDGRYFQGDINDPIWPGERYELVCVNIGDFNRHFKDYAYTPFQSSAPVSFNTRWNALSNDGEFARSKYLGQIIPNDIIHIKVDVEKTRNLFLDSPVSQEWPGTGAAVLPAYTFETSAPAPDGIPKSFTHSAKGAINSIVVGIEPSENALSYVLTIDGPAVKSFTIGYDALEQNGNTVFIDRNTPGMGGTMLPGGIYSVKVAACGNAYGTKVATQSGCNTGCYVKVENPQAMPSGFTLTADGYHGRMAVCIGNSVNAEYYDGVITGPINYPAVSAGQPVKLHSGYNYLSIPVPSADSLYSVKQAGLFRVQVSARNSLSQKPGSAASASSDTYVEIPYDLYAAQKDSLARPRISSALEKLGAVDLEVNFNDGNGWFALQTSGSDEEFAGVQKIDCRFSSFIDYKAQTFDLYFYPPAGPSGSHPSSFNVFAGGRTVADMYLRTRAKPCYRDTFWPRKGGPIRLSSVSASSTAELVRNLLWNSSYDATNIEDRWNCIAGIDPVLSAAGAKTDFFFAPSLERSYSVAAELVESFPGNPAAVPEKPSNADSVAQKNAILLKNITAGDGTMTFKVFYKAGSSANMAEDIAGTWIAASHSPGSSGEKDPLGVHMTIGNLVRNVPYMVAIYGFNEGKYSLSPLIRGPIYPYGPVSSEIPPISASVQAGSRNAIYVSSLYVPGESRYQINYKKKNETVWKCYDTCDAASHPLPYTGTVSTVLAGLDYLTVYEVKARAVSFTWDGVNNTEVGNWSNAVEVRTLDPVGTKPSFVLCVPPVPGNSVLLSDLKADGECRYQVWYKAAYPSTSDSTSTWIKYDTYSDGTADYGVVSKEFTGLDYWSRYIFKIRSVSLDATAVMLSGQDACKPLVGEWSDPVEIVTSNNGPCSAVLTILRDGVFPSARAAVGTITVPTLPFTLNSDITYDVTSYVSYIYGGSYEVYYESGGYVLSDSCTIPPTTGVTTYTAARLCGCVTNYPVPRGASSPPLETTVNTGYGRAPKIYEDFVTSTSIMGYKFTFHNNDASIPDFSVICGTTW